MIEEPIFLNRAELTPEEKKFREDIKELNKIIKHNTMQMFLAYGISQKIEKEGNKIEQLI